MLENMWLNLATSVLMTGIALDMGSPDWIAVNDGVMGGISSGRMVSMGDHLLFRGELSLENNGGFSSVRRAIETCPSNTDRVRLEVRGDGRTYQFRLRQDESFDGIAWRAEFTTSGEWQSIELRLADFEPVFRGRSVRNAGALLPSNIRQVGFMLADGKPGPFQLEIRAIEWLVQESERS